jgi:hypothetical protein
MCRGSSRSEESRPAGAQRRYEDSLYQARLAAWLRDSAVIDSITRTVDTDSLYRLHRSALAADNPEPIYQQIGCEGDRLYLRYGGNAARIAIKRMRDAVYKPGEADDVRRMEARLPRVVELSTEHCEPYTGPRAGTRLGETPLNTITPRPSPPLRVRR